MKNTIAIAAFRCTFGVSAVQAARNGTINFTGNVASQMCNSVINGVTVATVTLPTVKSNVLATEGNSTGKSAFNMTVAGYAATATSGAGTVKALFEKGTTVDSNGRLTNTASSGASNVVLQFVDGTENPLIVAGDIAQNTGNYSTISSENATLPYL